MSAQIHQLPSAATERTTDVHAFTSVTIWTDGGYYLQVHHGKFDTWEQAEDFATAGGLQLERRSNALFLVGPHGDAWIPDQATSIYRSFAGDSGSTYTMTLDDLFEVTDPIALDLVAIGSRPVDRAKPIVAAIMDSWEFQPANDENVD